MRRILNNAISLIVVVIVLFLVIPLHPSVLDVLLILNISLSIMILMITMNISEPLEFSILWYLCTRQGQVVSSEALFEAVWGEKYMDSNNTVMSHIARLREKMHEPSRRPRFIKTVWGVGYTIE